MNIPNSARLTYRLMDETDVDMLFEIDQDTAVMKYLNDGKPTPMETIVNKFIPRMNAYRNEQKGWGIWAVFDQSTQVYLGWVLVRPYGFFTDETEFDNLELGWRFYSHTWGNGYATEAADHIAEWVTKVDEITSICALAVPDNLASIQVMKKLGMEFVKQYIHHDPLGDWDVVYYKKLLS